MMIRPEKTSDRAAVRAVNTLAFETPTEVDLFDALREGAEPTVLPVAEDDGAVVGHGEVPRCFRSHVIRGLALLALSDVTFSLLLCL